MRSRCTRSRADLLLCAFGRCDALLLARKGGAAEGGLCTRFDNEFRQGPGRTCSPCACSSTPADLRHTCRASASRHALGSRSSSYLGSPCFSPVKLARSVLATNTTSTPGSRPFVRDFGTRRRFHHGNDHDVVVRDLPVIRSPQRAILSASLAALADGRILGKFDAFRTFSTSSTIGMMMPTAPRSVAFWMSPSVASGTRINGIAGRPSRHHHSRHVLVAHGAVLHFDPGEIKAAVAMAQ